MIDQLIAEFSKPIRPCEMGDSGEYKGKGCGDCYRKYVTFRGDGSVHIGYDCDSFDRRCPNFAEKISLEEHVIHFGPRKIVVETTVDLDKYGLSNAEIKRMIQSGELK